MSWTWPSSGIWAESFRPLASSFSVIRTRPRERPWVPPISLGIITHLIDSTQLLGQWQWTMRPRQSLVRPGFIPGPSDTMVLSHMFLVNPPVCLWEQLFAHNYCRTRVACHTICLHPMKWGLLEKRPCNNNHVLLSLCTYPSSPFYVATHLRGPPAPRSAGGWLLTRGGWLEGHEGESTPQNLYL